MSMNKKILLTLVPTFIVTVGIYLWYEINRTKLSYQKDFDESVRTSMTILGPALYTNIYNLEKFASQSAIKGIFANENIDKAISFGDDKKFFAGVIKDKNGTPIDVTDEVNLADFSKQWDVSSNKGFYIYKAKDDMRIFVFPLWSTATQQNPKESFGGAFVVEASTKALQSRINFMILRLIIGLGTSLIIAVSVTYLFLRSAIIKPIVKLMQASLDIAGGKYTKLPQPKDKNSDEIAMLTNNFNFMVNKIEHNLNLIRGISEASQEIVRCKTFSEIHQVYFNHSEKLVEAQEIQIWISSKGQPTEDANSLKRISDGQMLDSNAPMLVRILSARDVIPMADIGSSEGKNGICVPLINGRGILLGIVEIFFKSTKNTYGEEEIRIAHGMAVSATTAIENCWRIEEEKDKANMERDLELASAVQDSIVSKNIPKNPNCDVATYYKTAGQCGGDWFGAYDVGHNKLLVLFGDVTGHGTPAALITAVTRGSADMMRHFLMDSKTGGVNVSLPAMALEYLNDCIFGTGRQTYFMTMVSALIDFDTQKIYASSAGHTPPVLISIGEAAGAKYFYPKGGNRLGFQKGSKYEIQEFDFKPGQQVLFYTDGIIEGENKAGREYGMKKFKQSLETHGLNYPAELVRNVSLDAFQYFDGVPPKDDIAMLAVRFLTEEEKKTRPATDTTVIDVVKAA